MSAYRAVLLSLFVVGGALTATVPAVATTPDGVDAAADSPDGRTDATGATGTGVGSVDAQREATANNTTDDSLLGADISSFMQSSAEEVSGAVESGMWTASFNATDNGSRRTLLVERRTTRLRSELTDIRQRKAELVAERSEGNVSEIAYKAQISGLVGEIDSLQSSIAATKVRARMVNADVETLDALETETATLLTGPEIASVARNVTGVGHELFGDGERGPPTDIGNGVGSENGTGVGIGDEARNDTGVGLDTSVGNETDAGNDGESDGSNAIPDGDSLGDEGDARTTTTESAVDFPNVTAPTPTVTANDSSGTVLAAVAATLGLSTPVSTSVGTALALDRSASRRTAYWP